MKSSFFDPFLDPFFERVFSRTPPEFSGTWKNRHEVLLVSYTFSKWGSGGPGPGPPGTPQKGVQKRVQKWVIFDPQKCIFLTCIRKNTVFSSKSGFLQEIYFENRVFKVNFLQAAGNLLWKRGSYRKFTLKTGFWSKFPAGLQEIYFETCSPTGNLLQNPVFKVNFL